MTEGGTVAVVGDGAVGLMAVLAAKQLGADLFISAGTVKTHIANAQRKTGARNRVGMASWAWRNGLATP